MPGSFARDFGERSSVRRACQSLQGQVIRPKTRLSVFSRNAGRSQGRARAEYDIRAIVNQPPQSDSARLLQARATPIGGAQTSQTLAERRQRCDKTDAAPKNDPKRKKISKPRSETMIFRGICGIASLQTG
jgi:hypothetical protein